MYSVYGQRERGRVPGGTVLCIGLYGTFYSGGAVSYTGWYSAMHRVTRVVPLHRVVPAPGRRGIGGGVKHCKSVFTEASVVEGRIMPPLAP